MELLSIYTSAHRRTPIDAYIMSFAKDMAGRDAHIISERATTLSSDLNVLQIVFTILHDVKVLRTKSMCDIKFVCKLSLSL